MVFNLPPFNIVVNELLFSRILVFQLLYKAVVQNRYTPAKCSLTFSIFHLLLFL